MANNNWRTRRKDKRRFRPLDRIAAHNNSDKENNVRKRLVGSKRGLPRIKLESSKAEFSDLAIELVKDFNKSLAELRGKRYCVSDAKLRRILTQGIRYRADNIVPKKAVIRRAANVIAGITLQRPFCSLNEKTAIDTGLAYLSANSQELSEMQKSELAVLFNTNRKAPHLADIIERFLSKNL